MRSVLQIVSDPTRQAILRMVWNRERSAGEIAGRFPVTFGAVSQHLGVLRGAGLVEQRREGRLHFYRARREALGPLGVYLEQLWRSRLGALKSLAEAEETKRRAWHRKKSRQSK